jgi:hypothetical protein
MLTCEKCAHLKAFYAALVKEYVELLARYSNAITACDREPVDSILEAISREESLVIQARESLENHVAGHSDITNRYWAPVRALVHTPVG